MKKGKEKIAKWERKENEKKLGNTEKRETLKGNSFSMKYTGY